MIIGVPKEIKNNENRVGMTPSGVAEVVKQGHQVYIQHTAGINSGFPDEAYLSAGAQVLPTIPPPRINTLAGFTPGTPPRRIPFPPCGFSKKRAPS